MLKSHYVLLIAALVMLAGCKHKPAGPATVLRQPHLTVPTTESIVKEADERLRNEIEDFPKLEAGVNFIDAGGETWIKYPNGMMVHDLKPGDGVIPRLGQIVSLNYVGTFPESKKEFDKSQPDHPLVFPLGSKNFIKGFSIGVSTMHLGGRRRIYVPSEFAYGTRGKPDGGINPGQDLIFEVELLSVKGDAIELVTPDMLQVEPLGPKAPETKP